MISVIIPTFRRPESFVRAARSVFTQSGVGAFELVAIDNSPEGSALDLFETLANESPIPFHWAHEPRPGVAHARNAALQLAQGKLIAWLDDDQEAAPHWLAALVAVRRDTGAQCVFGPSIAKAEGPNHAFFENLYTRTGPAESGPITHAPGMGNSLQPRILFDEPAPFDVKSNETGGEDDMLFASLREVGASFAWAADALVTEHVSADRLRLAHGLKRAFAYGQGPCETAWAQRDVLSLARHMSVGAAQATVYGTAALYAWAGKSERALPLLDRAARGAGKVFWFCEQRFYGETLAKAA
jgi:succinoglycan biosynthesis protein ExoM